MPSTFPEESTPMPRVVYPCYGGPKDGAFREAGKGPPGYRAFPVRGRTVFLWKAIKVERLDFNTLFRASKITPGQEEETELDNEETQSEET